LSVFWSWGHDGVHSTGGRVPGEAVGAGVVVGGEVVEGSDVVSGWEVEVGATVVGPDVVSVLTMQAEHRMHSTRSIYTGARLIYDTHYNDIKSLSLASRNALCYPDR